MIITETNLMEVQPFSRKRYKFCGLFNNDNALNPFTRSLVTMIPFRDGRQSFRNYQHRTAYQHIIPLCEYKSRSHFGMIADQCRRDQEPINSYSFRKKATKRANATIQRTVDQPARRNKGGKPYNQSPGPFRSRGRHLVECKLTVRDKFLNL